MTRLHTIELQAGTVETKLWNKMKKLLIVPIMLAGMICKGQAKDSVYIRHKTFRKSQIDTLNTIFLDSNLFKIDKIIIDTVFHVYECLAKNKPEYIKTKFLISECKTCIGRPAEGYVLRKEYNGYDEFKNLEIDQSTGQIFIIYGYLNKNKKRFPNKYIVWVSK